jgi:alpha-maltose-1-phosphate synthase
MAERIGLLTREFPPHVYGGAGVHVTDLVPELRTWVDVDVHCFGEPRPDASAHRPPPGLHAVSPALSALSTDLSITAAVSGVDLVHSHTWYANFAGHTAKLLYGIPHVVTAHSLEPRRPWKAEQLGGGYRLSSWVERTAYEAADAIIAVSDGMRADVLECYPALDPARVHVVRNGIDTDRFHPVPDTDALHAFGIDPARPIVAFIGRITRQKGLDHLIAAARRIDRGAQIVLCAGAPDTPEIAEETSTAVAALTATRPGVVWIDRMLTHTEVLQVLSHATVFVCPSVYEPLGIVNLEAMACELAVVATATGGIPEVVVEGETGWLVPIEQVQDGTGTPVDPERFVADLAAALTEAVSDVDRAHRFGRAGRQRAVNSFSWASIGDRTLEVYRSVLGG